MLSMDYAQNTHFIGILIYHNIVWLLYSQHATISDDLPTRIITGAGMLIIVMRNHEFNNCSSHGQAKYSRIHDKWNYLDRWESNRHR